MLDMQMMNLQLFAEDTSDEGGDSQNNGTAQTQLGGDDMANKTQSAAEGSESQQASVQTQQAADPGMETVANLYNLLVSDPALANVVADAIEQYMRGGAQGSGAAQQAASQTTSQAAQQQQPAGESAGVQQAIPQELIDRLNRLERGQADLALERELNNARQLYKNLQNDFPILPDLNETELLRIAAQYPGLPLEQAVNIWAMQQMRSGEGTSPAERIMAAMMEKQQQEQPPAPEGRGGSAPSGEAPPPKNFRQARKGIRELLAAIDRGVTGA